uniref:EamA family transporter n=1 Tax=Actinacidiphila rubida TaxID=310780 RepID=UPI000A88019D
MAARKKDEPGGLPDGLIVGVIAFLLGVTLLVWTATGVAGLLAHGSWPSAVHFTRTPRAMRSLVQQPHDMAAAWPGAPAGELSSSGLFWGVFVAQIVLLLTAAMWLLNRIARLRGHRPPGLVWAGTSLAVVGVLILTGIDLSTDTRALAGDALALAAGMAAAGYMLLGSEVRRTASTTAYTFVCYSTTAVALLGACLVAGSSLGGYDGETWLKIAALTVVAQLLGHSLFNRVVRGLGPSTVSTAILLETPGAALIAAVWLGQTPPAAAYPA